MSVLALDMPQRRYGPSRSAGGLLDWTPEKAAAFTHADLVFDHPLHRRAMFSPAGLASALDVFPRDRLGVFTMGEDPVAWRTWRRGTADGMTGAQLMRAVEDGRIWLNLRAVDRVLPRYAAVRDQVFADKQGHGGVRTLKRDVALLISSPEVQVFYHLDTPLVSLWQIAGSKRVFVYPPRAPFVEDRQLERIVLKESAEQFAYDPAWDAEAAVFDLSPGRMVTWRQNAPHRVENGDSVNVSLSMEFMTPRALARANMIYGNGVLRRRLGLDPRIGDPFSPSGLVSIAVARAAKALRLQRTHERLLPVTFRLDPAKPGRVIDL